MCTRLRMCTLLLFIAVGLSAFSGLDAVPVTSRSCNYAGVFIVEGAHRYTLDFKGAKTTCQSLGSVLAPLENIKVAYSKGMETCRYGWNSNGSISIVRQSPHHNCANNQTGIQVQPGLQGQLYDAFCYDANDLSDKNCSAEFASSTSLFSTSSEHLPLGHDEHTTGAPTAQPIDLDEDVMDADTGMFAEEEEVSHAHSLTPDPGPQKTTLSPQGEKIEQYPLLHTTITVVETSEAGVQDSSKWSESTTNPYNTEEASGMTADPLEQKDEDLMIHGKGNEPTSPTSITATDESTPESPEHPNSRLMDTGMQPSSEEDGHTTPDWLIILAVVIAVVAIVLVCAAVVTRNRWCGKHQTLMITKEGGESNGAAASAGTEEREQEMVTLMHKENIQENGNKEEFTVIALEESPEKGQTA